MCFGAGGLAIRQWQSAVGFVGKGRLCWLRTLVDCFIQSEHKGTDVRPQAVTAGMQIVAGYEAPTIGNPHCLVEAESGGGLSHVESPPNLMTLPSLSLPLTSAWFMTMFSACAYLMSFSFA